MDQKKYTLINIVSSDVVMSFEEGLSPEDALEKYLELKKISEEIESPKSLIFLIEGNVIRKNIKDNKKR